MLPRSTKTLSETDVGVTYQAGTIVWARLLIVSNWTKARAGMVACLHRAQVYPGEPGLLFRCYRTFRQRVLAFAIRIDVEAATVWSETAL
jgi:hypothetical protein